MEVSPTSPERNTRRSQTGLFVFFMLVRILSNTVQRMVNPFLPVLARAFGVSPEIFARAMSIRSFAGLVNVFLSPRTDSRGRRYGMLLGNGLFVGGIALIVLRPTFITFVLGMGLSSLGKYVMDSAIQAYVGDEVPVRERGRAFGIIELGWSLSYLGGIWGVRILMERAGWLAPFPLIGFLGILAWGGFVLWVPAGRKPGETQPSIRHAMGEILRSRAAVPALLLGLAIASANEMVTVVFAVWLEDSLGFTIAALAGAAVAIGLAELAGESLVSVLTDRLGGVRAVRAGLLLNSLFAVLLPVFGRSPVGALIGLFLFYGTFEFTIVSAISLMTQVPTRSLATLMALNTAFLSVGRIASAWVALPVYRIGFFVVLGIAVLVNAAGLAALGRLSGRLDISDAEPPAAPAGLSGL